MKKTILSAAIAALTLSAGTASALDLKLGGGVKVDAKPEINADVEAKAGDAELKTGFLDPLKAASKDLQAAGMYFMAEGMKNPNNALAGSNDFMHLFGHVCLGLMWAKMAHASHAALAGGTTDEDFYRAKLATGRFYMARQLPATALHLARIQSGAEPVMALEAASF